jgi:hypothetical protein
MIPTDDTIYAIKISPAGSASLCAAAVVAPPDWGDREWLIDIQRQTRSLTGRELDEKISEDDIVSRRLFRCAVCGRRSRLSSSIAFDAFTVRVGDLAHSTLSIPSTKPAQRRHWYLGTVRRLRGHPESVMSLCP